MTALHPWSARHIQAWSALRLGCYINKGNETSDEIFFRHYPATKLIALLALPEISFMLARLIPLGCGCIQQRAFWSTRSRLSRLFSARLIAKYCALPCPVRNHPEPPLIESIRGCCRAAPGHGRCLLLRRASAWMRRKRVRARWMTIVHVATGGDGEGIREPLLVVRDESHASRRGSPPRRSRGGR